MTNNFSSSNYCNLCDELGRQDADLKKVLETYGYPPFWTRPNSFETLVHIILEQQVSLASAKAALEKLREESGLINPENFLKLNDETLRSCYFSRQKTAYVRNLAEAIVHRGLDLQKLESLGNDVVRAALVSLKGIGNWTADVYLMFTLHRTDVFPLGDLAAVKAMKMVKELEAQTPKPELERMATAWSPYRTIATMILWHFYLCLKKPLLT